LREKQECRFHAKAEVSAGKHLWRSTQSVVRSVKSDWTRSMADRPIRDLARQRDARQHTDVHE